ncbi:hypothetical protein EI94DRAFT_1700791 [Lactarius quietus]|nr:hypothetical protein EI94DRAFT_1700791 [Lactarius quietus]
MSGNGFSATVFSDGNLRSLERVIGEVPAAERTARPVRNVTYHPRTAVLVEQSIEEKPPGERAESYGKRHSPADRPTNHGIVAHAPSDLPREETPWLQWNRRSCTSTTSFPDPLNRETVKLFTILVHDGVVVRRSEPDLPHPRVSSPFSATWTSCCGASSTTNRYSRHGCGSKNIDNPMRGDVSREHLANLYYPEYRDAEQEAGSEIAAPLRKQPTPKKSVRSGRRKWSGEGGSRKGIHDTHFEEDDEVNEEEAQRHQVTKRLPSKSMPRPPTMPPTRGRRCAAACSAPRGGRQGQPAGLTGSLVTRSQSSSQPKRTVDGLHSPHYPALLAGPYMHHVLGLV